MFLPINSPAATRIRCIGPKSEAEIEKLKNETGAGYLELVEVVDTEEAFFKGIIDASLNWDSKTLLRL